MPMHGFPYRGSKILKARALKPAKNIRRLLAPIVFLSIFIRGHAAWGYMMCVSFNQLPEIDDPLIRERIIELVGEKNVAGIKRMGPGYYAAQPNKATCKACFYHLIRVIDGSPRTIFAFQGTGNYLEFEPYNLPIPELSGNYDSIAIETVDSYFRVEIPHGGGPVAVRIPPKEAINWLPRCSRTLAK